MARSTFFGVSVGAVAVMLATLPGAAFGQATDEEGNGRINEIIVTAQKREQTIQDTPLSVSAVSGDEIQRKAQGSLDAVLKNVAGVEVQGLAQGAQIYIRGVGSSIDPTFADPAIALMVDGAYNGRTESVQSASYDISRVEVLRGPQGTLYGRNASGGIVNVITRDPSLTESLSGYWTAQFGNYDHVRGEGAINVPVSDAVALRVAGYREKRDGFVDDGSYDSDSWGLRGKLLLEPTDWLRIVLKGDVYRARGKGANTVPVAGSAGNLTFPPPYFFTNFDPSITDGPPFTGGVPIQRFPNGWVQADPGNAWSNDAEHVPGYIRRKAETFSAQIDADLGPATLTLLPSYSRSANTLVSSFLFGSVLPFVGPTYTIEGNDNYSDQTTGATYKSIEVRLASNGKGPLQYVLGFYYLKSDPNDYVLETTGATNDGQAYTLSNTFQPGDTIAGFGQVTYALTDALRVTGGLRVSQDKIAQGYSIAIGGTDAGTYDFAQKQSSTQYKLGVEYDLAEKSLLYAHYSTGFKQGGISPTFPPIAFKPETLKAIEIGVKNTLFDDHLLFNAAVFHYDYKNYQFGVFQELNIADRAETANFSVIRNAGPTTIKGAEASVELAPWKNGRFTASVTYLDAKYGDALLPNNPFVNQGEVNLKGAQIQNSPDWSGNIGLEQGIEIGGGMLTLGVNSHLSTGYYVTPEQYLPGAYQKGYTRTDASVRYEIDGFTISANVKNIEDKAQTTYVFPAYRRFITAPRTAVLSVGYRF
ncbi:TonB-dependent receptor [Novosphingobium sp. fls2-241-R2A-195]|uniref:TonB-dependent receptor n=1 Tax=Novosphingobium sp. fls2-241-R2A-195 TaxID=3040296 RepID=UPI00254F27F5|nr:TonB-dependent receptor [Novosphingobium sp. fls2-241-R2A-195]